MIGDTPILYVFVRTDLPSMTPGKAQAHSAHAANAFVHEHVVSRLLSGESINPLVLKWVESTEHGFGTQINLKAPWVDVCGAYDEARRRGIPADLVTDPTYPYVVDSELLGLIDNHRHSAPPKEISNDRFMCFRAEHTAVYIFGTKSHLEYIVGGFPLHP